MKIGLIQFDQIWENKKSNKEKIKNMILKKGEIIDLLILPELSLTGFTMNSHKFAENDNDETFEFYSEIAKEKKCFVAGGFIEKENEEFFNTLILVDQNSNIKAKYRKIHPFSLAKENESYSSGKEIVTAEINGSKIGFTICYDLRFPELYRFYAKEKVDLIINIANWPVPRIHHWRILLQARAIENLCYIAAVNRIGEDPKGEYNGFSSVFDPTGKEIISSQNEEILITEIDKNLVEKTREKFNFLNDIKLI